MNIEKIFDLHAQINQLFLDHAFYYLIDNFNQLLTNKKFLLIYIYMLTTNVKRNLSFVVFSFKDEKKIFLVSCKRI